MVPGIASGAANGSTGNPCDSEDEPTTNRRKTMSLRLVVSFALWGTKYAQRELQLTLGKAL
ncbi:hypothetical protein GCM10029992_09690 [Glycomyces albus]